MAIAMATWLLPPTAWRKHTQVKGPVMEVTIP